MRWKIVGGSAATVVIPFLHTIEVGAKPVLEATHGVFETCASTTSRVEEMNQNTPERRIEDEERTGVH